MRDLSNLSWPEAPFGGAQRPFGQAARLVTAVTFAWAMTNGGPVPIGTAVSYLHVRRTGMLTISDVGYSFGFRVTLADDQVEVPELVALADRALVRARRQAVVLAGHDLDRDLERLAIWSPQRLAGVTGVHDAWRDRAAKGRGLAQMFDTRYDRTEVTAWLDQPLNRQDGLPDGHDLLAQALSIGLTAACRLGLLCWSGSFRARETISYAAWDLVDQTDQAASKGEQA
jgi:hypothetical protein